MKYISLCLFLTLICGLAWSQKSETLERINAEPYPESKKLMVALYPDQKKFKYTEDLPSTVQQDIPKYFSFRKKNRLLSIVVEFRNPLDYSFSLTTKESDDPNIKVESEFFGTVASTLPGSVTQSPSVSGRITGESKEATLGSSILIPEWFHLLRKEKGNENVDLKLITMKFIELEKYLYGKFLLTARESEKQSYEDHIFEIVDQIKQTKVASEYQAELTKANKAFLELTLINETTINERLEDLATVLKKKEGLVYTPEFELFTNNSIEKMRIVTKSIVNSRKVLIQSFKGILDRLNKVKIDGANILVTNDLKFSEKKDLHVTLSAKKITLDKNSLQISEVEPIENQFTIILKRPQVEASGGLAYLVKSISYNSYNTYLDSTSYRVGNTVTSKVVLPCLFLNFYRTGKELIWILPQIGIGTGKEYPTVLLGTGLVVPNKFIISLGLANAFNQHLKDDYRVDGKITSEQAKDAKELYEYQWELRPYLSIQLKF